MTPRPLSQFVRRTFSGPSQSDNGVRVCLPEDNERVDKVEFEREYCRVDFDLDQPKDDLAGRIQRHRVDDVWRLLEKVYECGINEGKRQVRETLREVIGI